MAIYPIKMLKDEEGHPFVPLTHIKAVAGEEYTTSILNAVKLENNYYKIENTDLDTESITDKIVAVKFDDVSGSGPVSYLKINDGNNYPIYKADGINPLLINGFENSVCWLSLNEEKWKLILVGTDESSGGGHAITDENGQVMTQRGVLNFQGLNVIDNPSKGATEISSRYKYIDLYIVNNKDLEPSVWTNILEEPYEILENGKYRLSGYLPFNDITSVGREIGIKTSLRNDAIWHYQYKRGKYDFCFTLSCTKGDKVNLMTYIDNITSTDAASLDGGYIVIEKLV